MQTGANKGGITIFTAKDLKEALANVPDDAILVASDRDFRSAEIIGVQLIDHYFGAPFDGKIVFFIDIEYFNDQEEE